MPGLDVLDVHNNRISNVSALSAVPRLRELNLANNCLSSVRSLWFFGDERRQGGGSAARRLCGTTKAQQ
jgi:hypothetical protein